jgi:hypothetical protein
MTTRDDKLLKLQEVTEPIAEQVYEDISQQAKIVAGNLFIGVGDKALLTASGFHYAVGSIHEAALAWFLAEGYVTLADKARASEDELAKRREKKALGEGTDAPAERAFGGYF